MVELGKREKVSITCDAWTSKSNDPYLGLTCDGIKYNWTMSSYNLSLQFMDESHTSHIIAAELRTIFNKWSLQDKIRNMVATIGLLDIL